MDRTSPPSVLEGRRDGEKEQEEVEGASNEEEVLENRENNNEMYVGLLKEFDQHLSANDRASSAYRVKSETKLLSTRAATSNSQGSPNHERGSGETHEQLGDTEPESGLHVAHGPSLGTQQCDRGERKRGEESDKGKVERGEDVRMGTRSTKDELKERWRVRKRERLEGREERGEKEWEKTERREKWSWAGRRREIEGPLEERNEESENAEQTGNEELESTGYSGIEGKNADDGEVKEGGNAEKEECHRPSPHPVLSRMLMSSSISSSSSYFTFSSAESDDVFSDGEDIASRRKTMRRCHSWKTFLTMMHWSVRRQSSWVQLAGHQGNFQLSEGGEVLKRFSEVEASCLQALMDDPLRPFVPQYHGIVTRGGHSYIRLQDLLSGLKNPVIMDCKMGVRTYQEEELIKARTKPTLRTDMYQKMVKADPSAPSAEEHEQRGVTKWRYLQWRDSTSSTCTLGFRIEGIMMENGSVQRDFKNTLTSAQVTEALLSFTKSQLHILKAYHSRLQDLSEALKESTFFKTHEVIGSSLLFVHDFTSKANIWMIDFGKTTPVPSGVRLRHNVPWAEGNREDEYLTGLAALTSSLGQAISQACRQEVENHGGEMLDTQTHPDEHKHTHPQEQGGEQGEGTQAEPTADGTDHTEHV